MQVLRGDSWAQALGQVLEGAPDAVDSWMARQARILKSDTHSRVGMLTLEDQLCYLKLYRYKSWLQRLGYRLGRGRALDAFDAARALRAAGVAVPEPLACLRVSGGVLLLTEGLADSADLKSLWLQGLEGERLVQAMQAAAQALARLHGSGFSHGDCKWSNFLCIGDDMLFIDLEGVRKATSGSTGIVRDLARFTLNAEDMGLAQGVYDDFLATYCASQQLDAGVLKQSVLKTLKPLRERHLQRYGPRGHSLL